MAQKPTQEPVDHHRMNHAEFQEFCFHVPHDWLAGRNIQRTSFLAVSFALSRHGTFKTGEDIRISHAGLSEESGASRNTVKKVVDFLKEAGAIEVVDHQRRQGTASENYRFRKSSTAAKVLKAKNRGKKPRKEVLPNEHLVTSVEHLVTPIEHLMQPVEHLVTSVEHNKVNNTTEEESEISPAPSSPLASPGDGAEKVSDDIDFLLDDLDERVEEDQSDLVTKLRLLTGAGRVPR